MLGLIHDQEAALIFASTLVLALNKKIKPVANFLERFLNNLIVRNRPLLDHNGEQCDARPIMKSV